MRALIQGLPYDSTRFVPKHDNTKGNSNRRLVEKNLIDQYNRLLSSIGQQYLLEDDLSMVQNDFQAIITANQHDYDVDDDDNDSDSVPSSMEFGT